MINKKVHINDIQYIDKPSYDLMESIRQRGVAIPVQVNVRSGCYECIDGHKRLTACAMLSKENKKFEMIPVLILNDYTKAGSAYWGNTQNKH